VHRPPKQELEIVTIYKICDNNFGVLFNLGSHEKFNACGKNISAGKNIFTGVIGLCKFK